MNKQGGSIVQRTSKLRRSRMLIHSTAAAVVFILVISSLPAVSAELPRADPESVGLSTERLGRITAHFQSLVDAQAIAGAQTLVARHGKVVHFESVGFADKESRRRVDEKTIFYIASMTKPVTAVALLTLYEEGRFRLTDPVSRYIPELSDLRVFAGTDENGDLILEDQHREITIQDLMRHTAGFTYGTPPHKRENVPPIPHLYNEAGVYDRDTTLRDMILKLSKIPLRFQPGTRWHYSVAVDVQAHLIEILSGIPFDEFLDSRIFEPLQMVDTAHYVPKEKASRLATIYSHEEGRLFEFPYFEDYLKKPVFLSGGGGLLSTSADYFRFAQMLANGGELEGIRILGRKTVEYMRTDHTTNIEMKDAWNDEGRGFGLGVGIITNPAESGMLSSRGDFFWLGGASTGFFIAPEEGLVAIQMMQQRPIRPNFDHDFRILVYQALVD